MIFSSTKFQIDNDAKVIYTSSLCPEQHLSSDLHPGVYNPESDLRFERSRHKTIQYSKRLNVKQEILILYFPKRVYLTASLLFSYIRWNFMVHLPFIPRNDNNNELINFNYILYYCSFPFIFVT